MQAPPHIGPYRVLDIVAEGGTATVFRAAAPDGRIVALKRVHLRDPGMRARFRREVAVLAALRHPNLIALLDHGDDPDAGPWLVTPLIAGTTLRERFGGARLCPEAVLLLLRPLLEALSVLHGAGLVHRDLKPDNAMITPEGDLYLMDLGLALRPDHTRLTEPGAVAGSVPYMSPEQVEGTGVTPASDVWALGVIAYELCTGRRPFARKGASEELAAIMGGFYPPLPQVDPRPSSAFAAMVSACLAPAPRDRPQSAAALLALVIDQIDWVVPAALRGELRALASDPAVYNRTLAQQRAAALCDAAEAGVGRGDLFGAVPLLDRALAYQPGDPRALAVLERATGARPAGGNAAMSAADVVTAVPATHVRTPTARSVPPTAAPHPQPVRSGPGANPPTGVNSTQLPRTASGVQTTRSSGSSPGVNTNVRSTPPATRTEARVPVADGRMRPVIAGVTLGVALLGGGGGMYLWLRPADGRAPAGVPAPAAPRPASSATTASIPSGLVTPSIPVAASAPVAPVPPVAAPTPSAAPEVVHVALSDAFSCALLRDTTVRCWGANTFGHLGDGSGVVQQRPVPVAGLRGVAGITLGGTHGCAWLLDGTMRCWGANNDGSLGDGTLERRNTPVAVEGVSEVVEAAAAGDTTCARRRDGSVLCWGENSYGQTGARPAEERCPLGHYCTMHPARVLLAAPATSLGASSALMCATLTTGEARCWGDPWAAFSDPDRDFVPRVVPHFAGATRVHPEGARGCAVFAARGVECEGNWAEALPLGLADATQIALGARMGCARIRDGTARCWGDNDRGQLGDGTRIDHATPVAVRGLTGVLEVAVGHNSACAVVTSGRLRCWGSNELGKLGDGTTDDRLTPVEPAF